MASRSRAAAQVAAYIKKHPIRGKGWGKGKGRIESNPILQAWMEELRDAGAGPKESAEILHALARENKLKLDKPIAPTTIAEWLRRHRSNG